MDNATRRKINRMAERFVQDVRDVVVIESDADRRAMFNQIFFALHREEEQAAEAAIG